MVVGGDYVTTESGTGLVHTAPGHGVDDFNTGRKHGLAVLCPVDEGGTLTAEAGPFAGLNVLKDANAAILAALRDTGTLLAEQSYAHRYPYDWRTKKPTIFRATEQWFASVEGFREQALSAIDAVTWMPERPPSSKAVPLTSGVWSLTVWLLTVTVGATPMAPATSVSLSLAASTAFPATSVAEATVTVRSWALRISPTGQLSSHSAPARSFCTATVGEAVRLPLPKPEMT